jgi:hypothetical protein
MFNLVDPEYAMEVKKLTSIAKKYKLDILIPEHHEEGTSYGTYILGNIILEDVETMNRTLLASFPGNCGILVVSSIQGKFVISSKGIASDHFLNPILASIEMAKFMRYARILISGTNDYMYKYLVEKMGFVCIEKDIYNPHSSNTNYILSKAVE